MLAGFTHLFASPVGYSAGYYVYKCGELLAGAALEKFHKAGVLDRQVGQRFVDTVLSKGGAGDAVDLFTAFSGFGLDPDALAEAYLRGEVALPEHN